MRRARKTAMTQARNAQTLFSGSLVDRIVSSIESTSCNFSFRPQLCVVFVIMNHKHTAPVATSANRKGTSTSKLIELIATELQSL